MEGGTEMIAPDKIWINTDTLNGYYMSNHPSCGEEYIRKDALMEWAKGQIWEYPEGNFERGIGDVIEKINSL